MQPKGMRGIRFTKPQIASALKVVALLKTIGENYAGKTPAQVAINWTIQKGTLPIPGAKNERQAKENLGAVGWQLSEDDVIRLDEVSNPVT